LLAIHWLVLAISNDMEPTAADSKPDRILPRTKLGVAVEPIPEPEEIPQGQMPREGKLYYTIGEVAMILQVKPTLIRFWETEFPHIRPKTNKKGDRRYRQSDIQAIKVIHNLVKEKGYTLQGAKEYINSRQQQTKQDTIQKLKEIRKFLKELTDLLDLRDNEEKNS